MLVCKVDPGAEAVFEEKPGEDFELPRNLGTPYERSNEIVIWPSHEGTIVLGWLLRQSPQNCLMIKICKLKTMLYLRSRHKSFPNRDPL